MIDEPHITIHENSFSLPDPKKRAEFQKRIAEEQKKIEEKIRKRTLKLNYSGKL